jgi:polyisoprenoid-binding protein YceI
MTRSEWPLAVLFTLLGLIVVGTVGACSASPGEVTTALPSPTHTSSPTLGPVEEPSPRAVSENTPTSESVGDNEITRTPTGEDTSTPTPANTPTPVEENSPTVSDLQTFQIVPEMSEARFIISEELLGNPKTVIGRTSEISGAVTVDLGGAQETQVTPIQVNARDLTTDDSFRNRALRSQILQSTQDDYQYILFEPISFAELPPATAVSIGEPFSFGITGDLTIRGTTQPVTFSMVVTPTSQTELRVSGTTMVQRSDYDLNIPSVPGVANVSEEVRLEVDLLATTSE